MYIDKEDRKKDPDYKYCNNCGGYWPKAEFPTSLYWNDGLQQLCIVCNPSRTEPIRCYISCIKCKQETHWEIPITNWKCGVCAYNPAKHLAKKRRNTELRLAKQRLREESEKIPKRTVGQILYKRLQSRKRNQQVSAAERKARLTGKPTNFTWEKWIQKVSFYGWRCVYCGKDLTYSTLTCDHYIPIIAPNSTHYISNLVPCCRSCNSRKNANRQWAIKHRFTEWASSGLLKTDAECLTATALKIYRGYHRARVLTHLQRDLDYRASLRKRK